MLLDVNDKLSAEILKMARKFGADLAGFVAIESLKYSPSHNMYFKLPEYFSSENHNDCTVSEKNRKGEINWPTGAKTFLIIALRHPEDEPALDYWCDPFQGGTKGNLQLIRINKKIVSWMEKKKNIKGKQIPYSVEQGGICLKDAAVLAGLGVVGKNNMLVTHQFGPRVRLRAISLPVKLPTSGPINFDPCLSCQMPCRMICPQGAFGKRIFSPSKYGQIELPAREGVYSRTTCNLEMIKNHAEADYIPIEGTEKSMRVADYCRACEFACPVGE